MSLLTNFFEMFLAAAPWLLLGYTVAALIKVWIPADFLARHLGDNRPITTIKAAFIGAPLPLCSCGVIPAALGLRRAGASKNATTAFLVATPETGVDSVAISYALLGPLLAVARPVAAISSAICAGLLVGRSDRDDNRSFQVIEPVKAPAASCCSSKSAPVDSCCSSKSAPADSCCSSKSAPADSCCSSKSAPVDACCSSKSGESPVSKADGDVSAKFWSLSSWRQTLKFALVDLISTTYLWLMIGLLFAALVQTFVSSEWLVQWGQGWQALLVMALIGVPMYICATASTPVAAGFLLAGVSPGAVLVFMLAGPATNIATLGLVRQELGTRALVAYLTGVIGCALLFGILVNWMVQHWSIPVTVASWQHSEHLYGFPTLASGLVLAVAMSAAAWRALQARRKLGH